MAGIRSLKLLLFILAWISSVVSQDFGDCAFDVTAEGVDSCNIIQDVKIFSVASWRIGTGAGAYFIGGPSRDNSQDGTGGYAFTTTTDMQETNTFHKKSWMLTGLVTNSTGGVGRCLSFAYATEGLSMESFEVRLVAFEGKPEDIFENGTLLDTARYRTTHLWKRTDTTRGEFRNARISFTAAGTYSMAFIGEPDNRYRRNRGYIAVDDITFTDGPCGNDCMFDSNTCSWSNSDTGDDEFDWRLARGSGKPGTGPSRDQSSSLNVDIATGGYAYIDSDYPRRRGDRARLVSSVFTITQPICIKFWLNMHGGGIGDIRLMYQSENNPNDTTEIWKLWKDDGTTSFGTDSWYPAQQTAFSLDPFRVIFEATVGFPGASDTALDTITIENEPCPSVPPRSNKGWGDCNFLYSACDWEVINVGVTGSCSMLDRVSESPFNPPGHTWIEFDLADSYMRFDLNCYYNQPRDEARLKSKPFSSDTTQCLSFWMYMFTVVATNTKFGALSVMVTDNLGRNRTIWKMQNQQQSGWTYAQVPIPPGTSMTVSIVGTKGPDLSGMIAVDDIAVFESECQVLPAQAQYGAGDCTFNKDPCQYTVFNPLETTDMPTLNWRFSDGNMLQVLRDHTFEADEGGFMYIDSINTDLKSHLRSADLKENVTYCFTFYFASFYGDNAAKLSVYSDVGGNSALLWFANQAILPPRPASSQQVNWQYAQVQIPQQDSAHQVVIEGEVRVGGWGIDDIKLYEDATDCEIRPEAAVPP